MEPSLWWTVWMFALICWAGVIGGCILNGAGRVWDFNRLLGMALIGFGVFLFCLTPYLMSLYLEYYFENN